MADERVRHAVATMTNGKRLRVPDAVQEHLGIKEGDQVVFYLAGEGTAMVVPTSRAMRELGDVEGHGPPRSGGGEDRVTTVTQGRRLRMPDRVQEHLGIGVGEQVVFYLLHDGTVAVVSAKRALRPLGEVTGQRPVRPRRPEKEG